MRINQHGCGGDSLYTRLNYARSRAGEAKPIEGCSMRSGLIYRAIIILHLPLDRSKPASTYKIIRIDPYTSTFTNVRDFYSYSL